MIFIYAAETPENVHPVSVNNSGRNKTSASFAKNKIQQPQWSVRYKSYNSDHSDNNPPDLPKEQTGPSIWKDAEFMVMLYLIPLNHLILMKAF